MVQTQATGRLRGAIATVVVSVWVLGTPANAQTSLPTSTKLLREEATFQLALTLKTQADQAYLRADLGSAKELYVESQRELDKLGSPWKEEHEARVATLAADIAYRRSLLDYKADFWGATFSLKPINPVAAFKLFEEDLSEFDNVVKQMQQAKEKVTSAEAVSAQLEAYRAAARTETDVQSLYAITEEIKANNHAYKATAAQAKIASNVQRQREIADDVRQLNKQFDEAHRALDSLVINGALQAAGVPPEIQQLASDKPLEQRILNAAGASLASNGPLVQSFGKLSETTASIVQMAQELKQDVDAVRKVEAASKAAIAAVRKGTIDGAFEAGSIIYSQLPHADQEKLTRLVVDKGKPIVALLETAKNTQVTLSAVVNVVLESDEMTRRMKELLQERMLENTSAFDQWYRKQLQAVVEGSGAASDLSVAEQVVRAWPTAFFQGLPKSWRDSLRGKTSAQTDEAAAKAVFGSWPPKYVTLQMDGNVIKARLEGEAANIDLRRFVEVQGAYSLEAIGEFASEAAIRGTADARQQMVQNLGSLLEPAMKQKQLFMRRFAESLDSLDDSSSLARLLPPTVFAGDPAALKRETEKAFESFWDRLPAEARNAAAVNLAAVQAGAIAGMKIVASDARQPPRGSVGTRGGSGAAQEAMLKAAVTACFPGAGVAFAAVEALKAFKQMSSLADRINELTAEDRAIMAEQLVLYDLVRDERAAVALAELGKRVADRRREGAVSQAERFSQAVWQMDDQAKRNVGAQRLFAPRAYLLAERLRARYDQLDRSLAFWTGNPRQPRGYLALVTIGDPQNLRYELDPAIQLFSWLDRSGESDRGDLPQLVEEWRRKRQLAKDACEKLGCTDQARQVGQVTTSAPELSLRNLFPEQWAKFEKWKAGGPAAGDFTFEFLLTPAMLKPHREHHGLRFVAARASVRRGGVLAAPDGNSLRHSGAAYVLYEDTYLKEHYLPDAVYDLTDKAFPSDLGQRWLKSLQLQPVEGYGVYTLWRFSLRNTPGNRTAEDVLLQFAYQFREKERVIDDSFLVARERASEVWGIRYRTGDAPLVKVSLAELPFFAEDARALQTLREMLRETGAREAGIADLRIEEETEGGK